jgi:hypothetical protein
MDITESESNTQKYNSIFWIYKPELLKVFAALSLSLLLIIYVMLETGKGINEILTSIVQKYLF